MEYTHIMLWYITSLQYTTSVISHVEIVYVWTILSSRTGSVMAKALYDSVYTWGQTLPRLYIAKVKTIDFQSAYYR